MTLTLLIYNLHFSIWFILCLILPVFHTQLACQMGYTCYEDISRLVIWVKKDDGNIHSPTCKKVCEDALLNINSTCISNQPPIFDIPSFSDIATGLNFSCLSGDCWNGISPTEAAGLMLVTYNIPNEKCYFPAPDYNQSLSCTTVPGNSNCFGDRFSIICPCTGITTNSPTTHNPTTTFPTTNQPTTHIPTTSDPTTTAPTTHVPTTAAPTTVMPTTSKPTTHVPTTAQPTTVTPTIYPTKFPTNDPTESTNNPTIQPTYNPTNDPTENANVVGTVNSGNIPKYNDDPGSIDRINIILYVVIGCILFVVIVCCILFILLYIKKKRKHVKTSQDTFACVSNAVTSQMIVKQLSETPITDQGNITKQLPVRITNNGENEIELEGINTTNINDGNESGSEYNDMYLDENDNNNDMTPGNVTPGHVTHGNITTGGKV
eukprot:158459_1